MKAHVFLVAVLALSCVPVKAGPSAADLAKADYGRPLPSNYQAVITDYMSQILRDPYSAHYTFTPIGPVWQKDGLLFGGKTHFGYGVQVLVNAKNAYGAYVGDQEYGFILHNGNVIKCFTPEELQVQHNSLFRRPSPF